MMRIQLWMITGMVAGMLLVAAPVSAGPAQPKVAVKTADYEFAYTYPAQAAAIPPLSAYFEADRTALRGQFTKDAVAGRRDSRANKYVFNSYEMIVDWTVVTDTPRLLGLSGSIYTFTGGAHGGTSSKSLVWDKARRARMATTDLFTSPTALWSAIKPDYCRALDVERGNRRGQSVTPSSDPFDQCPPLKDLTLLLGSSDRKGINRIGLIADQYVAGSYAEGPYEITLPVTPAVMAAVKPGYRATFAVKRP